MAHRGFSSSTFGLSEWVLNLIIILLGKSLLVKQHKVQCIVYFAACFFFLISVALDQFRWLGALSHVMGVGFQGIVPIIGDLLKIPLQLGVVRYHRGSGPIWARGPIIVTALTALTSPNPSPSSLLQEFTSPPRTTSPLLRDNDNSYLLIVNTVR